MTNRRRYRKRVAGSIRPLRSLHRVPLNQPLRQTIDANWRWISTNATTAPAAADDTVSLSFRFYATDGSSSRAVYRLCAAGLARCCRHAAVCRYECRARNAKNTIGLNSCRPAIPARPIAKRCPTVSRDMTRTRIKSGPAAMAWRVRTSETYIQPAAARATIQTFSVTPSDMRRRSTS